MIDCRGFHGESSDGSRARSALEKGLEVNAQEPSFWTTKAFIEWKFGNIMDSRRSLEHALMLAGWPPDAGTYLYVAWGNVAEVNQFLHSIRLAASQ